MYLIITLNLIIIHLLGGHRHLVHLCTWFCFSICLTALSKQKMSSLPLLILRTSKRCVLVPIKNEVYSAIIIQLTLHLQTRNSLESTISTKHKSNQNSFNSKLVECSVWRLNILRTGKYANKPIMQSPCRHA